MSWTRRTYVSSVGDIGVLLLDILFVIQTVLMLFMWLLVILVFINALSAGTEMLRLNSWGATSALDVFFFLKKQRTKIFFTLILSIKHSSWCDLLSTYSNKNMKLCLIFQKSFFKYKLNLEVSFVNCVQKLDTWLQLLILHMI